MKETKNVCDLLKQEAQWERMTAKQRIISIWFSLSFVLLSISGGSLLFAAVAVANFAAAACCMVKNVPMEEE